MILHFTNLHLESPEGTSLVVAVSRFPGKSEVEWSTVDIDDSTPEARVPRSSKKKPVI